jgi:hypothetical protein
MEKESMKTTKLGMFTLILLLAAPGMLWIESVSTQSLPKPSVPEFSVKYVDHSYDVPTTYGTDPYTGKTMVNQEGYHVQNNSVEVVIKNQAFTSYRNENGSLVWLYYRIVSKGHFESWEFEKWDSGTINMKMYDSYPTGYCVPSDESENTVVAYGLAGNGEDTAYKYNHHLDNVSIGGEVDFMVQAVIGYSTHINESFVGPPIGLEPGESYHYYIFTGECSEFSDTQTVRIGEPLTPNHLDAQTVLLGLDWEIVTIVGLVVAVVVLAVGLTVAWRRLPQK